MTSIDVVQDLTPRAQYMVASGGQTIFPYPFPIFDDGDLVVYDNTVLQVISTNYTVSGAGDDNGGNVTFTSGRTAGHIITIYRDIGIERLTDFQQNGPNLSASMNDELDRITLVQQQLESAIKRCLRVAQRSIATDDDTEIDDSWFDKYVHISSTGVPEPVSAIATTTLSQSAIALLLSPRTLAEIAAGAVPVNYWIQNHEQCGYANPLRYQTNSMPGTTDMSAGFSAAWAVANIAGCAACIPIGINLIASTLPTLTAAVKVFGFGDQSNIRPSVSGGNNVMVLAAAVNHFSLEDFSIDANINQANFTNDTANGQNCTGIKGLSGGGNYTSRWHIKNVRIAGLKVGADITGFIGSAYNLFFENCESGLLGTTFNSVLLNIRFENCRKDFVIVDGSGIELQQIICEGACKTTLSSTIDNCNGVKITAPYYENATNARTTPYLVVGGTTACKSVELESGAVVIGANAYNLALLKFDQVDGLEVSAWFGSGSARQSIETTANTKNIRFRHEYQSLQWPLDNSKALSRVRNLWPNSRFDAWFRGWRLVTLTNVTKSQETTLVRRGANALKLTCTASAGSHLASLDVDGPEVTALRGKTVMVGAWVWVPNIAAFQQATATAFPWVQVQSYNGSVTVSPSSTDNNVCVPNAWNFCTSKVTMQSDATRLIVNLYVNNSGNTLTVNEYIVVDEVMVVEGDQSLHAMLNGDVEDSPTLYSYVRNGLVTFYGTAAPNDAGQIYGQGDEVVKTDVAAAGSPGWCCTTGGAGGGTAVFKAKANVAA